MPDGNPPDAKLFRSLGLFDAIMVVTGGIIGSGIFINPYVVAQRVHRPALILGVWAAGGLLALAGAFIWAELACRLPGAGGQYRYLREAYHPVVAFLYGWGLLLVVQTGGMAAVAITFARYFRELTGVQMSDAWLASSTLLAVTAINCLGARTGSNVQSALMLLKAVAIAALVAAGLTVAKFAGAGGAGVGAAAMPESIGAAMIPVAFAYGGWQTSSFLAGEMRDPKRDLSRGLIFGVIAVVVLYLAVNYACLRALGAAGLAATRTPASDVMRRAWGTTGAFWIAAGIAVSTLGFLSQGILTSPRVYYAMARDGLFFKSVGWVSPRTGAPVVAIVLQGALAAIIAISGRYEQILNYVVSVDFISFGMTAATIFIFRRRAFRRHSPEKPDYAIPGHPVTTGLFVLACAAIVISTVVSFPANSAIGLTLMLTGIPAYLFWNRANR